MKKTLLLLAIMTSILLIGCQEVKVSERLDNKKKIETNKNSEEKQEEEIKNEDNKIISETDSEKNSEKNKKEKNKKGANYYISKNSLWNGNKEITSLKNKLPGTTESESNVTEPYDHSEWFQREDNENYYMYLIAAKGCGGCYVMPAEYLVISKTTGEFKIKKMNFKTKDGKKVDLPFKGITPMVSPDNTKVLFVTNSEDPLPTKPNKEIAYIYNLISNEIEKTIEVPQGKTVLDCMMDCKVTQEAAKWNDQTKTFDLKPL